MYNYYRQLISPPNRIMISEVIQKYGGTNYMKVFFDKLYKDDRNNELCGICVPFKRGTLDKEKLATLTILDGEKPVPTQSEVTSTWEDGSVRFLFVYFLANLPGNEKKEFELTFKGEESFETVASASKLCPEILDRIIICEKENTIEVSNGPLSFKVVAGTERLFDAFNYKGKDISPEQFIGPLVRIGGKSLRTYFDVWRTVKKGEIFSVLEGKGRFLPDNENEFTGEGVHFELRLSITAGKPWIDMGFRLVNKTDGNIKPDDIIFKVKGLGKTDITGNAQSSHEVFTTTGTKELPKFDLDAEKVSEGSGIRTMVGKSNYLTKFMISMDGEELTDEITAETIIETANEHFAEVFYGTFFADYTDRAEDFGVCATVYQAFQNFPKAVGANSDGVTVFLLPDQDETKKNSAADPVVFASGMAREQRFLLHFHNSEESIYELDNRSLIYQLPDAPHLDPSVFAKAGVMSDVFLPEDMQDMDVEIALIDRADSHVRSYGMLNFGDGPDPGYTKQGRGGGKLVWTNNEYDYPHAMYSMYARTGIRRFLEYANTAARHWMDVDVCHYSKDPLKMGGQWEHINNHTGASVEGEAGRGEIVCSHEWVEGLLDLYHFTADERALETAVGIGENVLRLLDTPMYQVPGEISARETGWALRTLTALFVETRDPKWTVKCEWIVSQFGEWNNRYGKWLAPYTDNTAIRVGFMISVALGSLMRYYRVFPGAELKKMILDAVDDLVENYMQPNGLFIYKELPSLARNNTNTLLLEAMSIGYELTGDERYLDKGYKTFKRAVVNNISPKVGGKRIVEDAVLDGEGAPKNFAQSFIPITGFYVHLVRANKLLP